LTECQDHFEYLEPDDDSSEAYVYEYPDLFREIGDALVVEQLHQDALRFYEPIQRQPQGIDSKFYFDIAICYQALGRDDDVKRTMEALRLFKRGARDVNFYVGLAKLYQSQGKETDMHYLIRQLRRMGKSDLVLAAGLPLPRDTARPVRGQTIIEEDDESQSDREGSQEFRQVRARSVRVRKGKRIEQQKFRERVVRNLYDQLLQLGQGLANQEPDAVADWVNIADQMLEEFKLEKLFFPREKATRFTGFDRWQRTVVLPENDMMFRGSTESEKEVPQHYCDIHFDEWLDVLLQLALQQARQGRKDICWDVMKTIQAANIFAHEPERMRKKRNVSLGK
jgi:general transcription factor 3C polypeptide 3 (transcription factor C subunit 4)